jgi:excinuclease UvrABC nuclease subunit
MDIPLHGSGTAAIELDGSVGPRAIPMLPYEIVSSNPVSAARKKSRAERDAEYDYARPAMKDYGFKDVVLPLNSPGLMLVRRLRDEAHRFALSYHRKLRDKRMHGSALEEVPGVGPRRKRLLLRTFGSIEGIRRATVEEIAAVPTMTKTLAAQVKDYLQDA